MLMQLRSRPQSQSASAKEEPMVGELTPERVEEMMQYVKERHRSEDDKAFWTK